MRGDHRLLPGPAGATGLPRVPTGGGRWLALATTLMLHLLALAGLFLLQPASRTAGGKTHELKLFMVEPPEPHPALSPDKNVDIPKPAARLRPARASDPPKSIEAPATPTTVMPPASAPPISPPAPATAPPPRPAPPEPRRAPADSASALAQYRQVLWARIHDHRPHGAGLGGAVLIRFRLDRDGRLLAADVLRGSGSIMLDKLALRSVRQSAPFPSPPAIVPDSGLTFDIPIDFQ